MSSCKFLLALATVISLLSSHVFGLGLDQLSSVGQPKSDVQSIEPQLVLSCPPGQVLTLQVNTSITVCGPCPRGYYCPGGISPALPCVSGTYTLLHNSTSCEVCAAGTVCIAVDRRPLKCQAGQYCPAGTYSTGVATFALAALGLLSKDHDYKLQDTTLDISCPTGYYCPDPQQPPVPCPCGTYNPDTEMTDSSACILCPPGNFCPQAASYPTPCTTACKSQCFSGSCYNCS